MVCDTVKLQYKEIWFIIGSILIILGICLGVCNIYTRYRNKISMEHSNFIQYKSEHFVGIIFFVSCILSGGLGLLPILNKSIQYNGILKWIIVSIWFMDIFKSIYINIVLDSIWNSPSYNDGLKCSCASYTYFLISISLISIITAAAFDVKTCLNARLIGLFTVYVIYNFMILLSVLWSNIISTHLRVYILLCLMVLLCRGILRVTSIESHSLILIDYGSMIFNILIVAFMGGGEYCFLVILNVSSPVSTKSDTQSSDDPEISGRELQSIASTAKPSEYVGYLPKHNIAIPLENLNDKGQVIGHRGNAKVIKVNSDKRKNINTNDTPTIEDYKTNTVLWNIDPPTLITRYMDNDDSMTETKSIEINITSIKPQESIVSGQPSPALPITTHLSLIIYDLEDVLVTQTHKLSSLYFILRSKEKSELLFGGKDRIDDLSKHFDNIKNNYGCTILLLSRIQTMTTMRLLRKVRLLSYFTFTIKNRELCNVIGNDSKVYKKAEYRMYAVLLEIMTFLEKDNDELLYISHNKHECQHISSINACQTYYIKTNGMTTKDMICIQKKTLNGLL